jgi:two-component system cell cycle sensor histidine kinase/response regulator CckA
MAGNRPSNTPKPTTGQAPTDTGTILVCEDDQHLGFVLELMLGEHGYHVLLTARPDEALKLAATHHDPIDLFITDVDLQETSGPELAQQLRRIRPEAEVLFVSGYSAHDHEHLRLPEGAAFLQKPFRPETLLNKARELLATPAV